MAVEFKGILKFQDLDFGWSELHWLIGVDLAGAEASLKAINEARMPLSNVDVKLVDAQIVDAVTPRLSFHPELTTWTKAGTYAVASTTISPNLAIMFRTEDATHEHRSRTYVRGFPSNQFVTGTGGPDALFTFTADYLLLMADYETAVKDNSLLVHKLAPHDFEAFPIFTCFHSLGAHFRRAGRPFNLPRGRRQIA